MLLPAVAILLGLEEYATGPHVAEPKMNTWDSILR